MIKLSDGILLYHGSYTEVSQINLEKCKGGLDFGRGFYVTSSREQAISYIPSAVRKAKFTNIIAKDFAVFDGIINTYCFHINPTLLVHYFDEADIHWLHFVAANRDNNLFPVLIEKFASVDIIGGKIADDNTAVTLSSYISGLFGEPGTPQADEVALKMLLPNRLKDQFCFRTEESIASLEFIRSERYGDIKP